MHKTRMFTTCRIDAYMRVYQPSYGVLNFTAMGQNATGLED